MRQCKVVSEAVKDFLLEIRARKIYLSERYTNHTSAFTSSKTAPGTGSGQNSSGVKLQSIRLTSGRLMDGHTYTAQQNISVKHLTREG